MLKKMIKLFQKEETFDEKKLYQMYGDCDLVQGSATILIIADTHGTLHEDEFADFLQKNPNYDICIMLGDHLPRDIDIILKYVEKRKIYGILGNHDYDYLSDYGITNIHGRIMNIHGIKILGMEGSFKYKPSSFPSFTHEESIEFLEMFPKVDLLVSHDQRFHPERINDPAHQGLKGITKYLYQNKVPIHIHGHIHENYEKTMFNHTKEISVFGYRIVQINNKEI